jgi:hypothetical protein
MTNLFRVSVRAVAGFLAVPLAAVSVTLAQSGEANFGSTCQSHSEIEDKLGARFKEKKVGHGISGDGNLIEVFMSSAGSFTVIKTNPTGISCIVDYGEGWQIIAPLESA